jgi:predicted phosphodiesterase
MKIIATGDIHGHFGDLNTLINSKKPDVLIQCGDNAYYWTQEFEEDNAYGFQKIKPGDCKVYLVPGNHENYDQIEKFVGRRGPDPIEIEPNIFYCPIGSTLELNGKRVMFIGGADSIDKHWRVAGVSWWAQEYLNSHDMNYCLQTPHKIDYIFSHTCPFDFRIFERLNIFEKASDPSMYALNQVFFALKPSKWFFGHWHEFVQGKVDDCRFWGLNCVPDTKWWMNVIIENEEVKDEELF